MEIIEQLGSLLGLSFISGINLYATVAVVGICTRFQLVQGLSPQFDPLGNDVVILVALLLYGLEFLMDKIPGLDTLWDTLHSLIRPFGGAMMALMQVGEASPGMEVVVFMLGATLASMAHVTKAGTRLIINTSPEPFSNILVSLVEDVGAVGLSYMSLAYPKMSLVITLTCLTAIVVVLPLILRTVRMLFSAILFRLKSTFTPGGIWSGLRSLPFKWDAFWDRHAPQESVLWTGQAYGIKIPGISRFAPVRVVITGTAIHFLHRRWGRIQAQVLPLTELKQEKAYPGTFLTRWLLRTSKADWMLYVYQPLFKTLPHDVVVRVERYELLPR